MEGGGAYAFSVLLDFDSGLLLDIGHAIRRKARSPSRVVDVASVAPGVYPWSAAFDRRYGSTASRTHANHGAGVDLRPADPFRTFSILGELCSFYGYTQSPLARRHLRTHQPAANQDHPKLKISIDSTGFSTTPRVTIGMFENLFIYFLV